MRRKDRQLETSAAYSILDRCEYGTLSMVHKDGGPYSVPVNYGLLDGTVYFHCAMEGVKTDCIAKEPRVSFSVVGNTEVLPDQFGTLYESVVIRGRALEAHGEVKQAALEALIRKYSHNHIEAGLRYIEKLFDRTRVFGIVSDNITGKARTAAQGSLG